MKISVIIPIYKSEAYLRQAIDSALGQTFADREVIAVDDGSPDESYAVVQSYGDRLRCRRQANAGVAVARNRAIEASSGEWIAFLDSDDAWPPDYLAKMAARAAEVPEAGLVYADKKYIDGEGKPVAVRTSPSVGLEGRVFKDLFLSNFISGPCSVMVKKSAWREAGGFTPGLVQVEDYDFWLRVARRFPVAYARGAFAYYRLHSGNLSGDKGDHMKKRLYMMVRAAALWRPEDGDASLMHSRLKAVHREAADCFLAGGRHGDLWRLAGDSLRRGLFSAGLARPLIKSLLPAGVRRALDRSSAEAA